ncbi:hypothetical protein PMIN01_12405 [Paraphaeosphaeria minitans]|uniref:Uncharacterized protein n=1 Tax=Paraphaeosphaeria minitans TaxID=565426 RepID=A0A9P6G6J8_9PLEO|nr:hypothetical protein PMIN01_12405 [Paraphaeosphaeria minitans]
MPNENTSDAAPPAGESHNKAEQPPSQPLPLPLPEPPVDSKAVKLNVSTGTAVKLDHLGPMVVNRDGTLSRIGNWQQMTDMEQTNTLRVLTKRNKQRLDALRAAEDAKPASE